MYKYPIDSLNYFSVLLQVNSNEHTMESSLQRYMEIKIHPFIEDYNYSKIIVRGMFDRSSGISNKEKTDKQFNYMRPTASIEDSVLYINCFPGIDYVYHYGNIIKSYMLSANKKIVVLHILPNEMVCLDAIINSGLKDIPKVSTVIMGYVEGFESISNDKIWHGSGNFLWKYVDSTSGDSILLGCKHTYWGEIAGRIVDYLAVNGVKRIIYSGKLGALNPTLFPNKTIATGDNSILPNGEKIQWHNIFQNVTDSCVFKGNHITVPSVLQESKDWLTQNINIADYVDSEIGHMALAAQNNGIEFSYFHIISDNLSVKYDADLSNERKKDVIVNRKKLCCKIASVLKNI